MLFGKKKGRSEAVLAALAPVIGGEVVREGHLRGTYQGRTVEVWLERIDPNPRQVSTSPTYADVIRLRVEAEGGVPWYVRSEPILSLAGGHSYEFIREAGAEAFGRLSPFRDLIPVSDPAVEARLQEAGLLAAIERVAPPSQLWLPRVRFAPDPRPAIMERIRAAGIPEPPSAAKKQKGLAEGSLLVGLSIDVQRDDDHDPTPERFRAMLDATLAIVELNARVNPA